MALLSKVPGMRVLAPSSVEDLQQMLHDAMTLANDGPVVIRYPKGSARSVDSSLFGSGLNALKLATGNGSIAILAIGKMVGAAEKALDALTAVGISATVYDVRSCAPLDPAMITDAAAHTHVLTVEDGLHDGGIGQLIADAVHVVNSSVHVESLGVPTKFIPHNKPDVILAQFGLDAAGITSAAQRLLA
jgi:1-deoxy-D-xylulose-5-phosphate synthase